MNKNKKNLINAGIGESLRVHMGRPIRNEHIKNVSTRIN